MMYEVVLTFESVKLSSSIVPFLWYHLFYNRTEAGTELVSAVDLYLKLATNW